MKVTKMRIFCDTSTIKAAKRTDLKNPITLAMHNFAEGFKAAGHDVVLGDRRPLDYDVAVVFGSITQRKMDTERAKSIQHHRDSGKKIISLDSAFFSTYIRNALNSSETFMFRVGIGDCIGTEPFKINTTTPIRYEWFEKTFKFEMKKPRPICEPIMFLLQTERGWQYDNLLAYKDWARHVLLKMREVTNKHIILRAHPNHAREPLEYISKGILNVSMQYGERARQSLIRDLENVGFAVTHSSSAAVETLVEGIPTIALDERCIAYDLCSNNLEDLNHPKNFDWSKRQQTFNDWANVTFHVNELKNPGIAIYNIERLTEFYK